MATESLFQLRSFWWPLNNHWLQVMALDIINGHSAYWCPVNRHQCQSIALGYPTGKSARCGNAPQSKIHNLSPNLKITNVVGWKDPDHKRLSESCQEIRQTNSAFLRFQFFSANVCWVLIIPQLLIFDFRTYCNTFWIIFGTSRKSTKSGPSGPLFITEMLQQIQANMKALSKNIIL